MFQDLNFKRFDKPIAHEVWTAATMICVVALQFAYYPHILKKIDDKCQ